MSYQVRHTRLGVFQGVELTPEGVAVCYHPAADTPEMSFCEFQTYAEARQFVLWALSVQDLGYKPTQLRVEYFNKQESDLVQHHGVRFIELEHWTKLLKLHE